MELNPAITTTFIITVQDSAPTIRFAIHFRTP